MCFAPCRQVWFIWCYCNNKRRFPISSFSQHEMFIWNMISSMRYISRTATHNTRFCITKIISLQAFNTRGEKEKAKKNFVVNDHWIDIKVNTAETTLFSRVKKTRWYKIMVIWEDGSSFKHMATWETLCNLYSSESEHLFYKINP